MVTVTRSGWRRWALIALALLLLTVGVVVVLVRQRGGQGPDASFATSAQIASLSTTSGAARRAKEILADQVMNGSLQGGSKDATTNVKDIKRTESGASRSPPLCGGNGPLTTPIWVH